MQKVLLLLFVFSLFGCNTAIDQETITAESAKTNAFFERIFERDLERNPEFKTRLGIKTDYDKWTDKADAVYDLELQLAKEDLQYLKDSVILAHLDDATKLSYQLKVQSLENEISDYQYRHYNYPVNQMFGLHSSVPAFLINMHQIADESDAKAYIARLNGVEEQFDTLIKNLQIREEAGIVLPKFVFDRVMDDCANVINGKPFSGSKPSTLQADFMKKVDALSIDEGSKTLLYNEANKALTKSVLPAYKKLILFLGDQKERATTDHGAWKFPNGEAFFANALNRTTTTELSSEEIHQIGLAEVERIHGEMREIMKKVGFDGSLQEFFNFLKTDDQFYYPNTPEGKTAYLDSAKSIIDNMEGRLDELFITKPKARIQVKAVEAFREKSAGKAFYQTGALDGSRPGTYYANLYNTRNMPKFEMEALAYHEGLPGHHMDRSISQELTDIPKFRKYGGYTAYVEGWGLYCEKIPKEMGLYEDPYSDYGRLAMELWRACRLVVDTGIHSKKWTREEGIDYYVTNTSGSSRECERMVERHIVMPSQATAYKIGMIKILELRAAAKEKLGEQFDIREFHEVVLTNGSVPLNVLEDLVDTWVNSKK